MIYPLHLPLVMVNLFSKVIVLLNLVLSSDIAGSFNLVPRTSPLAFGFRQENQGRGPGNEFEFTLKI